ncbi:chemotaxis protein CheW [Marinicella sp. W31]|uniref:chemotaxis protein CheW n=1 Tax=Marinicella sp. W31 TaxID=3023713 RepID=UPI003756D057
MAEGAIKPFELLLEYERRSLAHGQGGTDEEATLGDWSGIGFKLGMDYMVSDVDTVNEVLILPDVIAIPGIAPWVLGLVNIRSNLMPAVDLKLFLTGVPTKLTKHSRMLVVEQPGGIVGLVVDEVFGQRHFMEASKQEITGDREQGAEQYSEHAFADNDLNWKIFQVGSLVADPNFQNAAVR